MSQRGAFIIEDCLSLEEVASRLRCTPKTLGRFLRENPQEPPLFAKPGRDYIISEADLLRIYVLLQRLYGSLRFSVADLDARLARPARDIGYVYFIQGKTTRKIKIGFAVDPSRRIRVLRTGCTEEIELLAIVPGDRFTERDLHTKFHQFRENGEWFRPDRALLAFIKKAAAR